MNSPEVNPVWVATLFAYSTGNDKLTTITSPNLSLPFATVNLNCPLSYPSMNSGIKEMDFLVLKRWFIYQCFAFSSPY